MGPSVSTFGVLGPNELPPLIHRGVRQDLLCTRHIVSPHIIGCFVPIMDKELWKKERTSFVYVNSAKKKRPFFRTLSFKDNS
jgi:hypothetical protein